MALDKKYIVVSDKKGIVVPDKKDIVALDKDARREGWVGRLGRGDKARPPVSEKNILLYLFIFC